MNQAPTNKTDASFPITSLAPAAAILADFAAIPPVDCPCGQAQRSLFHPDNRLVSVHRVEIRSNARTHYHREHVEVYVGLEGDGQIELDGKLHPLHAGAVVLIPAGVRHRAVVRPGHVLRIINIVIPPFDPSDEWFD